eukprot:4132586-Pleurochrysis_carterae.AAC.3
MHTRKIKDQAELAHTPFYGELKRRRGVDRHTELRWRGRRLVDIHLEGERKLDKVLSGIRDGKIVGGPAAERRMHAACDKRKCRAVILDIYLKQPGFRACNKAQQRQQRNSACAERKVRGAL